jgi:putative hemolysin
MDKTEFKLSKLITKGTLGTIFRLFGPIVDRILGLKQMNDRYIKYGLSGMDANGFVTKLLEAFNVKIDFQNEQLRRIPKNGPIVFVANHPFGGIEGIILAKLLRRVRPDTKFLVNSILRSIVELREILIFTNPLVENHPGNVRSIRLCREWLAQGYPLTIFPAGRVAFYQRGKDAVTDAPWNRIAAGMVTMTHATVVPIHISGSNSTMFHFLGRIYYRFRLLMLPRELLKAANKTVTVRIGKPIPYSQLLNMKSGRKMTDYLRMRTYLLDPIQSIDNGNTKQQLLPIAAPIPGNILRLEIESLPEAQRLLSFQNMTVYHAGYDQIPQSIKEIARLREVTFRELNEGSGQELDMDQFDKTYIHLFLWDDSTSQIVGSYRMGPVDRLMKEGDTGQLYLSRLFRFSPSFIDRVSPGLELGRSFIRKEYQKSEFGLFLLWQGIGEYIVRHPHYHTMYGTVSLSTTYHPYSLALMSKVLVGDETEVEPISRFDPVLPLEVDLYVQNHRLSVKDLSQLIKSIEPDGTGIPILVKHYLKVGVRFHSIAIDRGFNNTPGALLSLDLRRAAPEVLEMYMEEKYPEYLRHHDIAV